MYLSNHTKHGLGHVNRVQKLAGLAAADEHSHTKDVCETLPAVAIGVDQCAEFEVRLGRENCGYSST